MPPTQSFCNSRTSVSKVIDDFASNNIRQRLRNIFHQRMEAIYNKWIHLKSAAYDFPYPCLLFLSDLAKNVTLS